MMGAPIVDSRMYNRYAYYNLGDRQRWVFGDGVIADLANPIHFYPTNGPYVATMTAKMITWTNAVLSELCDPNHKGEASPRF